ncbi:MAG: AMP-binding protein [Thermodesulfobacteriota bacterium]|nr:AMP-binding protein [Thermodesulfobacteriota bacterium]
MKERVGIETVYEYFEMSARQNSNNAALIYLGKIWTYDQMQKSIECLASSLQEVGIKKGDRAVIYMSNLPQWIIAWYALARLGAIPVPISPIYTPVDLEYMVNDSGAETIFCMDTNFGYVEEVFPKTGLKNIIVTTFIELLPLWKRALGKAFNKVPEGKYTLGKNVYSFKTLQDKSPSSLQPYSDIGVKGEEVSVILYTGGTTGFAKGVPFTNIKLLNSALTQRSATESLIPKGEDVFVHAAPLFHTLGLVMAISGNLASDTCVLLPKMHLDGLMDHVEKYRAKTFFGVPSLYRMILEHKRANYYDMKSLKYCFCGADVLPAEVGKKWLETYNVPLSQGYGATETIGALTLTFADDNAPGGSIGKLLPGRRIKVVDPDSLETVAEKEGGELLVASDYTVDGYWNKPEETAACFLKMDNEIWYRTKDMVRVDEDGWFYFQDRATDMIKHKGYRIAAAEIEVALQENPAVISSCVVGIPDQKVGERIKAFVVLKEDVKGVTGYDLIKWCRDRLAPYKIPQYIEFRDMLPKSKVGKLLRREIRSDERRKMEE